MVKPADQGRRRPRPLVLAAGLCALAGLRPPPVAARDSPELESGAASARVVVESGPLSAHAPTELLRSGGLQGLDVCASPAGLSSVSLLVAPDGTVRPLTPPEDPSLRASWDCLRREAAGLRLPAEAGPSVLIYTAARPPWTLQVAGHRSADTLFETWGETGLSTLDACRSEDTAGALPALRVIVSWDGSVPHLAPLRSTDPNLQACLDEKRSGLRFPCLSGSSRDCAAGILPHSAEDLGTTVIHYAAAPATDIAPPVMPTLQLIGEGSSHQAHRDSDAAKLRASWPGAGVLSLLSCASWDALPPVRLLVARDGSVPHIAAPQAVAPELHVCLEEQRPTLRFPPREAPGLVTIVFSPQEAADHRAASPANSPESSTTDTPIRLDVTGGLRGVELDAESTGIQALLDLCIEPGHAPPPLGVAIHRRGSAVVRPSDEAEQDDALVSCLESGDRALVFPEAEGDSQLWLGLPPGWSGHRFEQHEASLRAVQANQLASMLGTAGARSDQVLQPSTWAAGGIENLDVALAEVDRGQRPRSAGGTGPPGFPEADLADATLLSATGGLEEAPLNADTIGLHALVARCVAADAPLPHLRLTVHPSGEVLDIKSSGGAALDVQICLQEHRWRLQFSEADRPSLVDFTPVRRP